MVMVIKGFWNLMLRGNNIRSCFGKLFSCGLINLTRLGRQFGTSLTHFNEQGIDVKEIEIPVPWGKVAGRHWNDKPGRKPVFCVHGWMDNAASFDRLLPLLVKALPQYQYIAIDLPGHGRSSHIPPGMMYQMPDLLLLYYRIINHFNWKNINILAHSMGAISAFTFTATHPKVITVDKFAAIDALCPLIITEQKYLAKTPKWTGTMISFDEKLKSGFRPTYPFDEIVNKLMKSEIGGKDAVACKTLMTRGAEEHPPGSKKYTFSHDIRVNFMLMHGISAAETKHFFENYRGDVLKITAADGLHYAPKHIVDKEETWLTYDASGKTKGNVVRFMTLPGQHHIHLVTPEVVLPHIVKFFSEENYVIPGGK